MKLAVVGNLTVDQLDLGHMTEEAPGGSALYVSAAAAFLPSTVDLVSIIGEDYPVGVLEWLEKRGVNVSRVRVVGPRSTRFRLAYRNNSRRLWVLQAGRRLNMEELTGKWDAIHLGPVFRELDLALVRRARTLSRFLSLDVQGLLRSRGRGGTVRLNPADLSDFVRKVDVVKASEEEGRAMTSAKDPVVAAKRLLGKGAGHVIITRGREGLVLASGNRGVFRVPRYPEDRVVDPTGAGDVMIGAWLPTLKSTNDPVWASSVGSALASIVVRRVGLSKFRFSRRELFRRSAEVYKNVEFVEGPCQ